MKKLLCMLCMCVLSLSAGAQEQGKGGFWDKCFAEMSIGTGTPSHHVTPISGGINVHLPAMTRDRWLGIYGQV